MYWGIALLIARRSSFVVVEILDSLSARHASGVDFLGRCWTVTMQFKYAVMSFSALMIIEAVWSCLMCPVSQPNTTASLSTYAMTCVSWRRSGQLRNGNRRPIASNVAVLQPNACPFSSRA